MPRVPRAVRVADPDRPPANDHARKLAEAHEIYGEPLQFVVNNHTGVVHVLAGISDKDIGGDTVNADILINFLRGTWHMVCGETLHRHKGGPNQGSDRVGWFDDTKICQDCRYAFGNQAWRIFHCNQPPGHLRDEAAAYPSSEE